MSEELKYYNLGYTHDEIVQILKKVKDGEVLTKDQYNQLIREIGLENISVFDLNYYNLKNIPTIPVRVSELFNDSKYDTVPNVTRQIEELYQLLEDEITRIDGTIGQMNIIDIQEVLTDLDEANLRILELNERIDTSNKAIFSVERIIESINDRTAELILDMRNLSSTQKNESLKVDRVQRDIIFCNENIYNLLALIESIQDKMEAKSKEFKTLEEKINTFKYFDDSFQAAVDTLKDGIQGLESYYDKVSADIAILNGNIANYNADSVARFDALNEKFDAMDVKFDLMENKAIELIEDTVSDIFDKVNELEKEVQFDIDIKLFELQDAVEDLEESLNTVQNNTTNIINKELQQFNTMIGLLDKDLEILDSNLTSCNNKINAIQDNMNAVQDSIPKRLSELENDLDLVTSLEIIKHSLVTEEQYAALSDEEKNSTDVLYIVTDTSVSSVRSWLNNVLKR